MQQPHSHEGVDLQYQGRIEPPKAARGHATSNSFNIDSIVLKDTKNSAACKTAHTVKVLIFTHLA